MSKILDVRKEANAPRPWSSSAAAGARVGVGVAALSELVVHEGTKVSTTFVDVYVSHRWGGLIYREKRV